jgi:VIT1/CCC1 family predicted Fe2+/Mn2+ transporter
MNRYTALLFFAAVLVVAVSVVLVPEPWSFGVVVVTTMVLGRVAGGTINEK